MSAGTAIPKMLKLRMSFVQLLKPAISRIPWLATAYRRARDNNHISQPTRTPFGFLLQGNAKMANGTFEPNETRVFGQLIKRLDVLINVGANIGYYCCLALHEGKQVVAFEPMPGNLHHLLRNIKLNGYETHAEVFPVALSDCAGVIEIYGGGTGASIIRGWANVSEKYVTNVAVHTADSILGDRFKGQRSLVLVDVEGAENRFLAGAKKLLSLSPAPIWMVEITIKEHLPRGVSINPFLIETFDRFFAFGYKAWALSETIRQVSRGEIVTVATTGCDTLLTHNFLFAKDDVNLGEMVQ